MKSSNIGGQAVLEGIMMKHREDYAVAVRKPDGEIFVQKDTYPGIIPWKPLTTIPFVRGIFNFIDSMVLGIRTLTFSASFYEEEEEKEEAPLTDEEAARRERREKWLMRGTVAFSYVMLISRMEDIQRTFMYHGAEHKCINCIEHGLPLTVENVKQSSRQHKRCGTSFLFFVLAISIVLLLLIQVESPVMRVAIRVLLLPVIAGVSYEVLKLAGRSENPVVNLLSRPGLAIQKLTTREPDESMIEVAIAAVEAVFDWRAYEEENFHTSNDIPGRERTA